jgi:hypothetical protein
MPPSIAVSKDSKIPNKRFKFESFLSRLKLFYTKVQFRIKPAGLKIKQ